MIVRQENFQTSRNRDTRQVSDHRSWSSELETTRIEAVIGDRPSETGDCDGNKPGRRGAQSLVSRSNR